MRIDLRVKHDAETRRLAAELFADGSGRAAAAKRLSVPEAAVRRWRQIYRAFGSGVLLTMDGKRAGYTYEQKAAAARAVVEDGTVRALPRGRRGGAQVQAEGQAQGLEGQAARARPRGGLEERCRRLETEVAYLKNCAPWSRGTVSDRGEGRGGGRPAIRRTRPGAHARVLGAREVDLLLRAGAPGRADPPGAARRGGGDLLAHAERMRPPPGRHVPARRAGRARRRQDRAQDDARDGARCGIRRETDYHRYNSYRGVAGETFENAIGRDFSADAPWQKTGTGVTEFKQPWGKAYLAPVHDFGGKEMVAWSTSAGPDMAQRLALLDRLLAKMPEGATPDRQRLSGRSGEGPQLCAKRGDRYSRPRAALPLALLIPARRQPQGGPARVP